MKGKSHAVQPMRLATQVLQQEISFDQGLVRAQTANFLEGFIEGLNLLAQGDYFDLQKAKDRLRSGDALRAVEGRIPELSLPVKLQNWSLEALRRLDSDRPESDQAKVEPSAASVTSELAPESAAEQVEDHLEKAREELKSKEKELRNLQARRRECRELLSLLGYFEKNRPTSPRPWVGGLILVGWTLLLAGPVWLLFQSAAGIFFLLLAGILVAGLVVRREMVWCEHVRESDRVMAEQRRVNMELQRNAIAEADRNIQNLREESMRLADTFSENDRASLINSFPDIFVKPGAGPGESTRVPGD